MLTATSTGIVKQLMEVEANIPFRVLVTSIQPSFMLENCHVFVTCVDGGDGPCANATHVMKYDLVSLEPCNSIGNTDESDELEDETKQLVSNDVERLASTLEVGDHFAILAEPDDDSEALFWILLCGKLTHG